VVDGVGGAGLDIGVEHVVHGLDNALGGGKAALGIVSVGREGHDGVHGEDLPLAHLRLPAGGERQNHHDTQAGDHCSFYHRELFHKGFPFCVEKFSGESANLYLPYTGKFAIIPFVPVNGARCMILLLYQNLRFL